MWLVYAFVALAVFDLMAAFVWIATSNAENCGPDVQEWTCNEFLRGVSPYVLAAGVLALIGVFATGVERSAREGRKRLRR